MADLKYKSISPIVFGPKANAHEDDLFRFFPTDLIRDLKDFIAVGGPVEESFNENLSMIKTALGLSEKPDRFFLDKFGDKKIIPFFPGGGYIYSIINKVIFYESTTEITPMIQESIDLLEDSGWKLLPINVGSVNHAAIRGNMIEDLDFLATIYPLKHGGIGVITHPQLRTQFQDHVNELYTISINEIRGGGCNVADLSGGKVCVVANKKDAPLVFEILKDTSTASLIQAPVKFGEDGGWARCSMADFDFLLDKKEF